MTHKGFKWMSGVPAVFVLIAAIIGVAYAVDYYTKANQPSAKDPCLANLLQLSGAKDTWAVENRGTTNDSPVWTDLIGHDKYLRDQPTCYKGGTYTLGRVGEKPTCTVAGHAL